MSWVNSVLRQFLPHGLTSLSWVLETMRLTARTPQRERPLAQWRELVDEEVSNCPPRVTRQAVTKDLTSSSKFSGSCVLTLQTLPSGRRRLGQDPGTLTLNERTSKIETFMSDSGFNRSLIWRLVRAQSSGGGRWVTPQAVSVLELSRFRDNSRESS